MADTYEKDLAQKTSLTTSDYIRVVGTDNVSYKQIVSNVAKIILENYAGTTLGGNNQTVQSAISYLTPKAFALSANSSITLTVANNSRLALFSIGNNPNAMDIFLISTTSTGTVYRQQIAGASNITSTSTGANSLTITNSGTSGGGTLYAIVFAGGITQ